MAVSLIEPIAAWIIVNLINKYILPKFDLFAPCSSPPTEQPKEDDCVSSASSAATADVLHHAHF